MKYGFAPFLVIGIAFIVLGINGQRTFFAIGLVFLVLGFIMAIKLKRR
ncbi:MAG TPA: hypothetical protein VNO50_08865 [Pyrinomonadaceae bacterium]|nr:hypothetical protein [Pyrinomonadaceae bacterium]